MDAMSLSRGEITHVSDTALMVAACRALASESPDGFVQARYGDAPGAAATWNDADALMSAETPRCRRERISADLNDAAERRTIYAAAGPAPALVITEGLLMYLPAATVEALAAEAWQESGIAHWMSDITTTAFAKAINMDRTSLRNVQASDFLQFARG